MLWFERMYDAFNRIVSKKDKQFNVDNYPNNIQATDLQVIKSETHKNNNA
jgi:hypothetical protein